MGMVEFEPIRKGLVLKASCVHVIYKNKEIPGIELDRLQVDRASFEQFKAWFKFYGFKIVPRGAARIVVLSPEMYDCRKQPPFEWPDGKA
jgi:hypothetical protein